MLSQILFEPYNVYMDAFLEINCPDHCPQINIHGFQHWIEYELFYFELIWAPLPTLYENQNSLAFIAQ